MKEKMKVGDKVLFYHSNCKEPGVFALAEIAKEGYPDDTAWDPAHPYFDERSDQANPTWYMVDIRFIRRLEHPPTLALIKLLAQLSSVPDESKYIGPEGLKALKGMALVNRGRLSVQPVEDKAFEAIVLLGDKGGWEGMQGLKKALKPKGTKEVSKEDAKPKPGKASKAKHEGDREGVSAANPAKGAKRKSAPSTIKGEIGVKAEVKPDTESGRPSKRTRE